MLEAVVVSEAVVSEPHWQCRSEVVVYLGEVRVACLLGRPECRR